MTMRPMTRRSALVSGAALASTAVLSSCGGSDDDAETLDKIANPDENINPEGMPIVDEQVTITFMSARPTTTAEDWNDVSAVKAAEELTNVHVDFGLVRSEEHTSELQSRGHL